MTPEQAQIYLSRIQSLLVEMPIFNGSERFPDFHNLVCEAFDNLVAVENYLKRQLVNHDSTGLALSPAQPVEAVGQGATDYDLVMPEFSALGGLSEPRQFILDSMFDDHKYLPESTSYDPCSHHSRRPLNKCSFCGGSGECPDCSCVGFTDFGEFHCSTCRDTGECPKCQD